MVYFLIIKIGIYGWFLSPSELVKYPGSAEDRVFIATKEFFFFEKGKQQKRVN
jgi:hypothetical protein